MEETYKIPKTRVTKKSAEQVMQEIMNRNDSSKSNEGGPQGPATSAKDIGIAQVVRSEQEKSNELSATHHKMRSLDEIVAALKKHKEIRKVHPCPPKPGPARDEWNRDWAEIDHEVYMAKYVTEEEAKRYGADPLKLGLSPDVRHLLCKYENGGKVWQVVTLGYVVEESPICWLSEWVLQPDSYEQPFGEFWVAGDFPSPSAGPVVIIDGENFSIDSRYWEDFYGRQFAGREEFEKAIASLTPLPDQARKAFLDH